MAEVLRMPKMSDTMEEGVIAAWVKKEGDEVNSGDILAEVETDKAIMELESYQDGILLHINAKEKEAVPVNSILAIIGEKGEAFQHLLTEEGHKAQNNVEEQAKRESPLKTLADTSNVRASIIRMPKMSDTMEEGRIAAWLKKVGDPITSGDILAEVETDKATMELEAYEDGTLLHIGVEQGNTATVDDIIAIIGEKGTNYEALLTTESSDEKELYSKKETEITTALSSTMLSRQHVSETNIGRIKASPLARKIAAEINIDLSSIQGSGDGGRIIKRDVEHLKPSVTPSQQMDAEMKTSDAQIPKIVGEEHTENVPLSPMRKAIAKRLSESKFSAPHFYLTIEINMDKAIEARNSMNETSPIKISFNDIIVKAAATALRKHPDVNVSWGENHLIRYAHIHIGVAVAIPSGLIVPVIRFADNKTLSHISAETKSLSRRARDKTLRPEEYQGATFTISNLGMLGIEEFTAVINPPASCIMAVGHIKETVVVKNGKMKPGNVMKVTMSCDHRTVDGAVGAAFLKTFKELMEEPILILM